MPTNTALSYMYRCGANYKSHGRIVLSGLLTGDQIDRLEAALESGMNFIANQVGIPEMFPWKTGEGEYDDEHDHCWHEFCEVEQTDDTATDPRCASELVAHFEKASREGWRAYVADSVWG